MPDSQLCSHQLQLQRTLRCRWCQSLCTSHRRYRRVWTGLHRCHGSLLDSEHRLWPRKARSSQLRKWNKVWMDLCQCLLSLQRTDDRKLATALCKYRCHTWHTGWMETSPYQLYRLSTDHTQSSPLRSKTHYCIGRTVLLGLHPGQPHRQNIVCTLFGQAPNTRQQHKLCRPLLLLDPGRLCQLHSLCTRWTPRRHTGQSNRKRMR